MARSNLVARHHVIEGVVKAVAQIGIDLFLQCPPGRKPRRSPASTAGRDRMMRSDRSALEQLRGVGDGQVGLAGAGGAYAENKLGALHGAQCRRPGSACGR